MTSDRIKLTQLADALARPVDLFVCSASYEARCRSIADQLPVGQVRRALVAETEHRARYASDNGGYLRQRFGDAAVAAVLDPGDPVATADALWAGLLSSLPA